MHRARVHPGLGVLGLGFSRGSVIPGTEIQYSVIHSSKSMLDLYKSEKSQAREIPVRSRARSFLGSIDVQHRPKGMNN
jgi:hypothetical protein